MIARAAVRVVFLATTSATVGAALATTSCDPQRWAFEAMDAAVAVIDSNAGSTVTSPRDATGASDAGATDGGIEFPFDGDASSQGGGSCNGVACRSCNPPLCADGGGCPFGRCAASCDTAHPCQEPGTFCVNGGCVECVPAGMMTMGTSCEGGRTCIEGFCMGHR